MGLLCTLINGYLYYLIQTRRFSWLLPTCGLPKVLTIKIMLKLILLGSINFQITFWERKTGFPKRLNGLLRNVEYLHGQLRHWPEILLQKRPLLHIFSEA